ncbi:hypothetical protein KIH27_07715 [Mycobacterium sp. M1]|uniref:DUF1214 domain-containing protein n=1 Tax=Mycolicibacter acidiphilus TaxID=2835306 RepID=A0ABS5RH18_9MYCO|nr:hypothetical protein [Mycolicibacter acidiphilus]MBS9533474.1 hypothetical protein [Mycolicibacter acidiphilus]
MNAALRPYVTTGIALVGASVIVATPAASSAPDALVRAVHLTAGSSELQSAVDALHHAAQQISATNSAYPFVTAFDLTRLPQYIQNTAMAGLRLQLNQVNSDNSYDLNGGVFRYLTNANAAEPQSFNNDPNPDTYYQFTNIGNQTQTVTIDPGPGTKDVTFTPMAGNGLTQDFVSLRGYDLSQFTPNADGTYTITLSPTEQPGNWVDTSGAQTLITRDTLGDWGLLHDNITYESAFKMPVLSDGQITTTLNALAEAMVHDNGAPTNFGIQHLQNTLPDNSFTPITSTLGQIAGGPILPGQLASFGHFELGPDQALIVKVPNIDAAYSAIQSNDAWANDYPSVIAQGSLNSTNTFQGADGFTYYVISSQDPGVANWIDNSGAPDGNVLLRWQGVTGNGPAAGVHTEVVNIADVHNALPDDMPTVTAAERAADLQLRLFEYGYSQDQFLGPGWVTAHLELDQIKNAIGADEFNQIFGGQLDVPSVLDRLTDSTLVPDMSALSHVVFANPAGSLSALINNLPLAVKDIEMPMVLAVLRLDLALGSGGHALGLDTLLKDTFTDPASSITAGILNARDDLSVAIMHADSYTLSASDFSSAWDQLAQSGQSVSEMLSAGFSYLLGDLAP